jgi:hypothetical protein
VQRDLHLSTRQRLSGHYVSSNTTLRQTLRFSERYISANSKPLYTTPSPCTPSLNAHHISLNILFYKYNSITQAQTLRPTNTASSHTTHLQLLSWHYNSPTQISAQTTFPHTHNRALLTFVSIVPFRYIHIPQPLPLITSAISHNLYLGVPRSTFRVPHIHSLFLPSCYITVTYDDTGTTAHIRQTQRTPCAS